MKKVTTFRDLLDLMGDHSGLVDNRNNMYRLYMNATDPIEKELYSNEVNLYNRQIKLAETTDISKIKQYFQNGVTYK